MTDLDGILIVDKPKGITSSQLVSRIRRSLNTKKVGHAGTLDPMATGVMVVGVNRATRMLGYLALHDKAYAAVIRLGQSTTTDDAEGEITSQKDASNIDIADVKKAIVPLTGQIMQVPSRVSAIKLNGKRAYARARAGEDFELAARQVMVSRFDLLDSFAHDQVLDLVVALEVSSGTYVRALARDLGQALGVGAHLIQLQRTRVGKYAISQAITLDDVEESSLMPMAKAAKLSFPCLDVNFDQAKAISYGQPLDIQVNSDVVGMISDEGKLLALYQPHGDGIRPLAVLV